MKEIRCTKCDKLLGKAKGIVEIKCPRCNTINKTEK
ncbi:Com family DNA-binding transcriptional regulator [Bacillus sp. B15-48]|nr:Com family DNA-binding transcriptional regulator [Bacillus sp. B15-48]